jgi:hypothetical protein
VPEGDYGGRKETQTSGDCFLAAFQALLPQLIEGYALQCGAGEDGAEFLPFASALGSSDIILTAKKAMALLLQVAP